jgi:hypothetical protein
MASLEAWMATEPSAAAIFFVCAAAAGLLLARWRERASLEIFEPNYEDPGDPAVRTLELTAS